MLAQDTEWFQEETVQKRVEFGAATPVPARPVSGRAGRGGNLMLEQLEQQKKLTANQWKIIATANLGDMLDFFDFFLIGYVLAFIVTGWSLTFGQSALILLASGLGAVPGAFFWGWRSRQ